ncbi:hypothetical protein AK972_2167 [Pseudomonas yamanorum]|nr:hypothetical protein AK972_2167 [Pseudomonas yamanorum]
MASILVHDHRVGVCRDTNAGEVTCLLSGCQRLDCACQNPRFGSPANTTGTQGKTRATLSPDNRRQLR